MSRVDNVLIVTSDDEQMDIDELVLAAEFDGEDYCVFQKDTHRAFVMAWQAEPSQFTIPRNDAAIIIAELLRQNYRVHKSERLAKATATRRSAKIP